MWQDKLKEIIYILEQSDVNEIDVTFLGRRFRVVKSKPVVSQSNVASDITTLPAETTQTMDEETIPSTDAEESMSGNKILSPMPGTFYRSPNPDDDPFVQEGDTVKKGDILCVIEAMKIMNEIEVEEDGIIRKILVENAQPVEYNQPVFIIDTNV